MTNKGEYILWIGSLLNITDLEKGLTASIAAVRWQTGLAEGILNKNIPIHCINKPSGTYWPNGPLILGRKNVVFFHNIKGIETRFLNIPKLRTHLMSHAYLRALKRILRDYAQPKVVIFYNITKQNVSLYYQLKYKYNIPCIILAADIPAINHNDFSIYKKACSKADGIVYLSRSEFVNSTIENKIHMDGGISRKTLERRLDNVPKIKPYLMYTGAFEEYCGVSLIVDALKYTNDNFKLVICGNCKNKILLKRFKNNPRIDYKGFVSEKELDELSRHAMGFVNSYLPSAPETDGKFPSKIFEYLSYGHPVISTLTSGIAPEYEQILFTVNKEDAALMASKFEEAYDLYKNNNRSQIAKNNAFLMSRTWDDQAERFLDFLNKCTI